jgi:hypothetical protein
VSFLTWLALGLVALVAIPYLAHRLRRRKSDDKPFSFVALVPPSLPQARRRSRLEDRALFGLRAAAVVLLALLGATPFVTCSRLSLDRGGASVALAIVVDDSMSMRAKDANGRTRFSRAIDGAKQLLASTREGDSVAIVLAGAPPRVGLAASTDLNAANGTLDTLVASDRATDIDGAVAMARSLIAQLPQQDKRVVLLSDLADGTDKPLPDEENLWVPLSDIAGEAPDCAVLSADRTSKDVHVEIACSPRGSAEGRDVVLKAAANVIGKAKAGAGTRVQLTLPVPKDAPEDLDVVLEGKDAVAEDDIAAVVVEGSATSIGVVGDTVDEIAATGGAPVTEQALAALKTDLDVRPLADLPDKSADLAPFAGLVFDDPPGLTPEARSVLSDYMERGGVVLFALGPRASRAPLGAGFLPIITTIPAWEPTKATGAKPGEGPLGEGAQSLVDLAPKGRAILTDEDARAFAPWLVWNDGALFLGRREIGKGEALVITLPLSLDESDLPLRPGFLAILDAFVLRARARSSPRRSEAGATFQVPDGAVVEGPHGRVALVHEPTGVRATVPDIGRYRVKIGDRTETRVTSPVARELDLRPRPATPKGHAKIGAGPAAKLDVSWIVALALLGLFLAEIVARLLTRTEPAA